MSGEKLDLDGYPSEDDIAEKGGIDLVGAEPVIEESERAGSSGGRGGVEPPAVGLPGGEAVGAFGFGERPAGAGIERAFGTVRGMGDAGNLLLDFPSGAEAGIEEVLLPQGIEWALVGGEAL